MAGLLDLFSGRSSDIYGNGLLTPEQRGGLGNIGLLALAGKLGQLAGPSFSPVPDFGAALGQAAGAYGASQEGAGTAALNAILTGQKGRKLEQELDYYKQLGPVLGKLAGQWPGADSGAGGGEGSGSTGGGAAAPAGAGGGGGGTGGWGPHAETAADVFRKAGWSEAAIQGALANGLAEGGFSDPWRKAGGGENSYGHWQLNAGGELPGFQKFAGGSTDTAQQAAYVVQRLNQIAPGYGQIQDPKAATDIFATKFERYAGAAPGQRYGQLATVQQKLGAATTAAAPAGGGPGGLLAPTVPNPLSDAEPMVGIPRPAPQAAAAPGERALVQRYAAETAGTPNPPSYPEWKARLGGSIIERTQGFGPMLGRPIAPSSGGGGLLAAPPGAGGDPIMSVTSADQAGGGDAPGAAAPRAPLPVMGPAGIELPPMQGPLAAPAPAAAAPTAPGPGLLSRPGAALPGAPVIPRGANPAYDAFLRNAAGVAALTTAAGLPNILGPYIEAFTKSPSYQAELERAKARVGVEFAGPKTTAEKTAAEPFAIAASERELKNALIKEGWQLDEKGNAVPIPLYNDVAAAKANAISVAQEGPKLDSALAQQNKQRVYDANGKFLAIMPIPGGVEADTAAAAAKARVEAGERSKFETEKVTVFGPDGRNEETTMSKYEIAQRRQQVAERVAKGVVAPQPGDIVGTPVFSDFEKGIQAGGTKWFETQRAAADTAAKNIQWNNESIKLLDSGLYAGWGAPVALQFARVFNIGGKSEAEKIQNTQKFLLERGQQVAAQVKAQPGSASDKDVEFANRLSLGDITLDEGTIRQMLELYNKYNRQTVDQYNDAAGRIRPDVIGGLPLKVPVDAPLKPMDPESRQNAQAAIARGAKPGPIRNKIRAQGFDPEGL